MGQPLSHAAAALSAPESCLLFGYGRARGLARFASVLWSLGAFCHKLDGHPHNVAETRADPMANNTQCLSALPNLRAGNAVASMCVSLALRFGWLDFCQHTTRAVVILAQKLDRTLT